MYGDYVIIFANAYHYTTQNPNSGVFDARIKNDVLEHIASQTALDLINAFNASMDYKSAFFDGSGIMNLTDSGCTPGRTLIIQMTATTPSKESANDLETKLENADLKSEYENADGVSVTVCSTAAHISVRREFLDAPPPPPMPQAANVIMESSVENTGLILAAVAVVIVVALAAFGTRAARLIPGKSKN